MTVSSNMMVSLAVVGPCPHPLWRTCDVKSVPAYHRVPLGAWSTLAVSGRVVFGLEGNCAGLTGSPAR